VSASAIMKRPFARAKGSVRRTPTVEADSGTGGADMAQTAETAAFQRTAEQGRKSFAGSGAGSKSFGNLEPASPGGPRRGFVREARMSFVG